LPKQGGQDSAGGTSTASEWHTNDPTGQRFRLSAYEKQVPFRNWHGPAPDVHGGQEHWEYPAAQVDVAAAAKGAHRPVVCCWHTPLVP